MNISILLIAVFVLLVSAILARRDMKGRTVASEKGDTKSRRFLERRFLRRIQIDAMVAFVGALLFVLAIPGIGPWLFSILVFVMLLVLIWIMLLAVADFVATAHHSVPDHQENQAEIARLKSEAAKLRKEKGEK